MAESPQGGERTEEPSQRRLTEARERGQVPRSRELTNFATMIGGSAALIAMGTTLTGTIIMITRAMSTTTTYTTTTSRACRCAWTGRWTRRKSPPG